MYVPHKCDRVTRIHLGLDFEAEGKFVIFGPEMMLFPGSGSGAAPGSGMESGCVTVAALEDNVYEDPESLSLVVDIVTSGVAEVRGSDTTTVTIMDATGMYLCVLYMNIEILVNPIEFRLTRLYSGQYSSKPY